MGVGVTVVMDGCWWWWGGGTKADLSDENDAPLKACISTIIGVWKYTYWQGSHG